jgi:hypothetical protein
LPVVSAVPGLPSAEQLSALPAAGLAVRLAGAYRLIAELTGQVERLTALNERLSARVDELERRARQDSSTSSRPPSSDGPHKKEKRTTDRSLRERGKRRPGKQPGDPGVTMCLVDDPDESYDCPPAACRRCGAGLAGEPVTASRRHQVTDIGPPPEPKVTQYVAQAKECPCCRTVTEGELPAHVRARASYGPEACAQAANLTCGHYIPVHRAVILSPFWISPGHEGFLRVRHVADVRLCARLRTQKRSDKGMDAGHVDDIAYGASWTPLKITRPPRSSKGP